MGKSTLILTLIVVLFFNIQVFAADKVVVVPLVTGVSGTDGQLQYNDKGKTAGAELYYDKATKILKTDGEFHISDEAGYGIGLQYVIPQSDGDPYGSILDINPVDSAPAISIYLKRMVFSKRVGIMNQTPLATLDINGYAKLRSYDSAPVTCTENMRGTIVMNDDYDLCVCRPATLGSAFKLVRDSNLNCW